MVLDDFLCQLESDWLRGIGGEQKPRQKSLRATARSSAFAIGSEHYRGAGQSLGPDVSTAVGAEGLDVQHARDILIEDSPAGFADAIVKFLQHPDVRRRYEAAAAATARKYDWSVITLRFVEVLQKTIQTAWNENAQNQPRPTGARA